MSELVAAARRYIDTRFVHQGRSSSGLDCVGLIWIAYRDCGVELDAHRAYPGEPNTREMVARIRACLGEPVAAGRVRAEQLQVGDVVMLVLPRERLPHHVGLITDYRLGGLAFLHANSMARAVGRARLHGRVVEHRLDDRLIESITHVFRRPV